MYVAIGEYKTHYNIINNIYIHCYVYYRVKKNSTEIYHAIILVISPTLVHKMTQQSKKPLLSSHVLENSIFKVICDED